MAQMNCCMVCKFYNIKKDGCSFYKKIPKDIFLERIECEHYEMKEYDYDSDPTLPIAKGR